MKRFNIAILGLYISLSPINYCVGETFNNPSPPLLITEIMPNPKGADKGEEWIEIYNTTEQRIDLGNWKLNNSKIFTIPEGLSILPKDYFVLQGDNLKITLKNSSSSISLLDPSNNLIQEIPYPKTKDNQSYSLITLKSSTKNKKSWTLTSPTKGLPNQTYYLLIGKIIKPPTIDKEFFFEISTSGKSITIIFNEENFNFDLLSSTLKESTEGIFLVEKLENHLILKNLKITKNPETQINQSKKLTTKSNPYILLIPISIMTLILLYLLKRPRTSSLPSSPDKPIQQTPL